MKVVHTLAALLFFLTVHSPVVAVTDTSAFWLGGTNNNDMNTPANWSGNAVPGNTAVFQEGTLTPNLILQVPLTLDTFLFPALTPNNAYTFTIGDVSLAGSNLTFNGVGIVLDNINQQTFNVGTDGKIIFNGTASASTGQASPPAFYKLTNDQSDLGGDLDFYNNSTAGNAQVNGDNLSSVNFFDNSTAETAQIHMGNGSLINFQSTATADFSVLSVDLGSQIVFNDSTTAAHSSISATNGSAVYFYDDSHMGSASITADGTGSAINYQSSVSFSEAQITLLNGGLFSLQAPLISVATLSGNSSGVLDLAGNTFQVGNRSSSSTYDGIITDSFGGGSFDKVDNGTFVFNGMGNYTGDTDVQGGIYILNGTLTGTPVIVEAGAVFSGTGTIGQGSLTVLGDVIPGALDNVGTLTLVTSSPFTQLGGSTFTANVNGLGGSSFLNVLGSFANIQANSTFTVATPDGTALIGSQYSYHVMHADQGIFGTYATVNSSNPFLVPHLLYDPTGAATDIFLTLSTDFSSFAKTENEACVAAFFDRLSLGTPDDDEEEILMSLASIETIGGLSVALNQISGEQYTYLGQLSEYTDYRFARRLFSSIRNLILPTRCRCLPQCNYINTWARVEYDYAHVSGNKKVRGLHDNSWDVSVGGHYFMSPQLAVGGAIDYSQDYLSFNRDKTNNLLQTFQGALYALYNHTDLYFFSNLILGESWSNRFERHLRFDSLDRRTRSCPALFHGKAYLEVGTEFDVGCVALFEPFFGIDVGWYDLNRTCERGAGLLNRTIHRKERAYGDTFLGFHLLECAGRGLSLSGDLYWQHRFRTSGSDDLEIGFRSFDTRCLVEGNRFYEDGIVGSLNVATCLKNWDLYVELNGERWGRFTSYGATFGIGTWW